MLNFVTFFFSFTHESNISFIALPEFNDLQVVKALRCKCCTLANLFLLMSDVIELALLTSRWMFRFPFMVLNGAWNTANDLHMNALLIYAQVGFII